MEPKIKETAWNPELEKQILKQWQDSHIYDFKPEGDVFVIDTPPPYPSGRPWHIGAAAHYAQIDMIARTALDDREAEMIQIMKNLGLSGNFSEYYRTDSEEYRTLTQSTFIDLWKKGLVYLANRPNNYDWVTGTTIADAEITYQEIPTKLVHMKFKIKDFEKSLIVASTRPELLCACQTVIVNPEDERYTDLIGKKVTIPIVNREVEILTHPSAEKEFGS